jgi:enediyne biosynthesis protein E4
MGIDAGDIDRSGAQSVAITNFDGEMIALYKPGANGVYKDIAQATGIGPASQNTLGFGCMFLDADLDGNLDLFAANGHIDETARNIRGMTGYAQAPQLFLNNGRGQFHDVARQAGEAFAAPKVARGAAFGDFDNDGDVDLLVTTNHGPAYLYRNDVTSGNRSIRLRLRGTKSNRDAIGAVARLTTADGTQSRMVRSGSSYLSQSELALTFGIGRGDRASRLVIEWPSGRVDDHGALTAGAYDCVEGSKPTPR